MSPAQPAVGWDDPRTAAAYETFCERHGRYAEANDALVARAAIPSDAHVLDVAAGTGRTAQAALGFLGRTGRILCMEPAGAMRVRGRARLEDPRVEWTEALPRSGSFQRILSGAALWQLLPLSETFERLRGICAPDGALVFDVPSLYLGEADEPGGGGDPRLMDLMSALGEGRRSRAPETAPMPDARGIEALLTAAGFRAERWTFRLRLTQEALRDWLKIPVITDALLGDLAPEERDRLIDAAFTRVDPGSWRWEAWTGWTAWAV